MCAYVYIYVNAVRFRNTKIFNGNTHVTGVVEDSRGRLLNMLEFFLGMFALQIIKCKYHITFFYTKQYITISVRGQWLIIVSLAHIPNYNYHV